MNKKIDLVECTRINDLRFLNGFATPEFRGGPMCSNSFSTASLDETQHMSIDTVRLGSRPDAEAIAKLANYAYRPEIGTPGWTHESSLVSGSRTNARQVEDIISKSDSVILVGLKGSEIVACVHIERDGNNSHIGMLAVSPTLQGAGIGKEMLSHAERYASENFGSEKFIMLVVSARSELISFYIRRGYQQTGDIMDYPLSAGAGTPKHIDLKIEVLEKRSNHALKYGLGQHAYGASPKPAG